MHSSRESEKSLSELRNVSATRVHNRRHGFYTRQLMTALTSLSVCLSVCLFGVHKVMPGWFAGQYGKLGGTFALMGKPNRIIFEAALDQYREKASGGGDAPVAPRVLVVGDSLVHDIGGGTNNGFDTLLITSGIHQREIYGTEDTDSPRRCAPGDDEAIANRIVELCREFECALPTYFTEKFVF